MTDLSIESQEQDFLQMGKKSVRGNKRGPKIKTYHSEDFNGNGVVRRQHQNINLKEIVPITRNQEKTFDSWDSGKHLVLHGTAGTGKSFLSLYLALTELLSENSQYEKLVIIRSAVPTRDIGHLPGSIQEKTEPYERASAESINELCGRGDAYEILKKKEIIQFMTTSHIRGITLRNAIVLADEINNDSFHELDSVMTRAGEGTRMIFCGDYKQSDLTKSYEREGLLDFLEILKVMKSFSFVEFTSDDIVRSELVKEYIITKESIFVED